MNEMYNMSIGIHGVGAIALFGVLILNIVILKLASSLQKYKRWMSIVLLPLTATTISLVIFTGIIMMAAKHLDFSLLNILMIVLSVALIILETKRAKALKYINAKKERALEAYRAFGLRILYIEFVLSFIVSAWMWLA